jgi:hypothetical protein
MPTKVVSFKEHLSKVMMINVRMGGFEVFWVLHHVNGRA